MNGINYSSLLSNLGLFSNQQATDKDQVKLFNGSLAGTSNRASQTKVDDKKQTNTDRDTYEYSGAARNEKAGYERPKRVEASKEQEYKALDSDGIQEGIKLSDSAKNLLAELREKYGNMDIAVAEWSTDEEQDYYASLSKKQYSVLINPELLEEMAADESVRAQYESVLSSAGEKLDTIKEELGEDADKIKSFTITMDSEGKVTYSVQLLKDMAESSKAKKKEDAQAAEKERTEKRREAKKKAEEELEEKVVQKRQETEKVEANTIEDLIAAIKAKLHPEEAADTNTENGEIAVTGQAVTA